MDHKREKLPVFGVGPVYVLTCLLLTLLGLYLWRYNYLSFGDLMQLKAFCYSLGFLSILLGLYLWLEAVVVQKINKKVKEDQLITDGVYGIVRHPVYSAFFFILTGCLLLTGNWCLLILPLVFYLFLTWLMLQTEEKWLRDKFGKEYDDYCKEVHRVIPFFRKKRKE
ncbi:isoprenylcysteine carboxylmethyltransferase family protein [Atopobacter sp. AH10]|uniref:methyltransferase family protein n=1 Tax=Atopobacter sp. AH10 TaxID=2315861 RepID=UPI000EF23E4B|nr:isoprenylcysteine carboxylmethyltransferase family protein [Atopobacter sp. AH10]RLK62439.1 isoprenylcysteine carboxylmethyltransferase family protein [Atopobacter sp. AH10]